MLYYNVEAAFHPFRHSLCLSCLAIFIENAATIMTSTHYFTTDAEAIATSTTAIDFNIAASVSPSARFRSVELITEIRWYLLCCLAAVVIRLCIVV